MVMPNRKVVQFPEQGSSSEVFSGSPTTSRFLMYMNANNPNTESQVVSDMAENATFQTLMNKMIQDQSDIRRELSTSEERTSARVAQVEDRMDQRLNRIEDMIMRSSDRTDKKIDGMELKLSGFETRFDAKVAALESKVDGNNKWIFGISLTTILGIAAMVITIIITK